MSTSTLSDLLSCPICRGTLSVAMLLPCSHTFCSQCIRRSLKSNPKLGCPVCFNTSDSSQLIPVRLIDQIIDQQRSGHIAVNTRLPGQPRPAVVTFASCSQRQRLSAFSTDTASVGDLRKQLSRYGVNCSGSVAELKARYIEFTVMFESNQDLPVPRDISVIASQLNSLCTSRARGAPTQEGSSFYASSASPSNSHEALIKRLREQQGPRAPRAKRQAISSSEDTPVNLDPELDFEILPSPWRKVWSKVYERSVYFNPVSREGQFTRPV